MKFDDQPLTYSAEEMRQLADSELAKAWRLEQVERSAARRALAERAEHLRVQRHRIESERQEARLRAARLEEDFDRQFAELAAAEKQLADDRSSFERERVEPVGAAEPPRAEVEP